MQAKREVRQKTCQFNPIMSQCTYCDSFVSRDFIRVFGDHTGRVYACPNCTANAGIGQVSAERKAAGL